MRAWIRIAVGVIALSLVFLVAYLVQPHGRVYFVMDSRILGDDATVKLPPGEYSLLLISRNYGLPLKNARVIFGVQQRHYSLNYTIAYELRAHTEPVIQTDTHSFIWEHANIGSFSRRTHNVTIRVDRACVLDVVGLLTYPWHKEREVGGDMVYFRRMLHLEIS